MNQSIAALRRIFLFACLLAGTRAISLAADKLPEGGNGAVVSLESIGKHGVPPQAITRAVPEYPPGLLRGGFSGRVMVQFIITTEGKVVDPIIAESNNPWFERPALEAILKWKFKPGLVDGRPVNVQATQLLLFEADQGGHSLWSVRKGKDLEKLPPEFQWAKPPEPKATAFPVYPLAALQAGQKGTVKAVFIVDPRGEVRDAAIAEATTPEMGEAVLAMLDAWWFTPATKKDGTPCSAALAMQFAFEPSFARGDVPVSEEMIQIVHDLKETPPKVVPIGELDTMPRPLSRRPPLYPSTLRSVGEQGEAVIEFFIDRNGDAQLPHIVRSSASQFGYAAAQAVATWRFEAPRKNGKPVTTQARITLHFTLKPHPAAAAAEKK